MKLVVRGITVNINESRDFLASGGEGRVFGCGDTLYKLYHDPAKVIPRQKMDELSALDRPNIVRPLEYISDPRGTLVGVTMRWVKDSVALARLFSPVYRRERGIKDDSIWRVIQAIRDTTEFIHSKGVTLVDGNEFNYLVQERGLSVFFIDTDSYQTQSFPATAVMPSIRDYHAKKFGPESDWFSFGIVACQLFLGIHPYRGTHPKFSKKDMEGRMRANVSIFNQDVSLPSTAGDPAAIPPGYREWFIRIFEKGERLAPPETLGGSPVTVRARRRSVPIGTLTITQVLDAGGDIMAYIYHNGVDYTATADRIFVGRRSFSRASPVSSLLPTHESPTGALEVYIAADGRVTSVAVGGGTTSASIVAESLTTWEDRAIAKSGDTIVGLRPARAAGGHVLVAEKSWGVMPHSTHVHSGVIHSDVLGKAHLYLPFVFGKKRDLGCAIARVPELDGHHVVHMRRQRGVVVATVLNPAKEVVTAVMRFGDLAASQPEHDTRWLQSDTEPNFFVLDNDVCVLQVDDELEVFHGTPGSPDVARIPAPGLPDGKLVSRGAQGGILADNKLSSLTMRKK